MKLTRMEPVEIAMPANRHGAATYGEWCKAETKRIGGDARYIEETRTTTDHGKEKTRQWCRVDRFED